MEDKITYGVFWRTTENKEWHSFFSWFPKYKDAENALQMALSAGQCIEAGIVERVETFEFTVIKQGAKSNG